MLDVSDVEDDSVWSGDLADDVVDGEVVLETSDWGRDVDYVLDVEGEEKHGVVDDDGLVHE